MASSNGGGNSRKIGRNSKFATLYAASGRLARNKARTLTRHQKRMAKKAAHRAAYDAKKAPRKSFSEAA